MERSRQDAGFLTTGVSLVHLFSSVGATLVVFVVCRTTYKAIDPVEPRVVDERDVSNSSPFPSFLLLPNLFPISLASLSPHRQLALRSPSKASGEKEFPARYLQLLELRGATRKVLYLDLFLSSVLARVLSCRQSIGPRRVYWRLIFGIAGDSSSIPMWDFLFDLWPRGEEEEKGFFWAMTGTITEDYGMSLRSSATEGMLSEQRCPSGDSITEWRSCEQVENGTPSTSPLYWDTDDDEDGSELSSPQFVIFLFL
ncbi:hypothetical protein BHM03_00043106 [Ensete ventricosum]|nr:hypothetical protein BHM03_00043106 [Ensete ventricosum]